MTLSLSANPTVFRHDAFCRSTIRQVLLLVPAIVVTTAFAQTSWTDGTGDWFTAGNWSAGVPDSTHAAYVNNGGTAQLAANGGTISGVLLGRNAAESGTLSISGAGSLTTDNAVEVGQSGTGFLNITGGGHLSDSRLLIGTNSGSHGTVTVSGTGSSLSGNAAVSFIGFSGTATLNISSAGTVSTLNNVSIGESSGSNGTVTVDGAGSKWTVGGSVDIAGAATGSLSITNGGFFQAGGATIARNFGSNGTVNVSGGSTFKDFDYLVVADGSSPSSGALHVSSGSSVSNTYSIVGGSGGNGTVTVDGVNSTWTNSSTLTVGSDMGTGSMTITASAKVSNTTGYIGVKGFGSGQAVGTVTVDGAGSSWTNSGNLYVGGNESGAGANGTLRIQNGGSVSAVSTTVWSTGTIEVGANPTLTGSLAFAGGKLRAVADSTFASNASLGTGGVKVDSNNFSLGLSGMYSGSGGLTKMGAGAASLSGSNTYTGGTTVSAGTLLVNNSSGSGTGTAAVQVNAGTIGGTGTLAGAVTIGTGSGTGATISPGNSAGSLTIQSALTLKSDATYKFELDTNTGIADKIIANGVTITGALFSFSDLGSVHPDFGMVFVILDNTSSSAINGTFSNLADNSIFTNNGNMYLVSYSGASGNDLTLTVVPEPATWALVASGLLPLLVCWQRRCFNANR